MEGRQRSVAKDPIAQRGHLFKGRNRAELSAIIECKHTDFRDVLPSGDRCQVVAIGERGFLQRGDGLREIHCQQLILVVIAVHIKSAVPNGRYLMALNGLRNDQMPVEALLGGKSQDGPGGLVEVQGIGGPFRGIGNPPGLGRQLPDLLRGLTGTFRRLRILEQAGLGKLDPQAVQKLLRLL